MKLAMNGALTIGTLDGANVEIQDVVGEENIFIFGLTVDEVQALRAGGAYLPRDQYQRNPILKRIVDSLASDRFCPKEPGIFRWISDALLDRGDPYFLLTDLPSYIEAQDRVGQAFTQPVSWAAKAILNTARSGGFSSDRTVAEYAREIWGLTPVR
jgi:glycogen phosphorylase